MNRIADNIEATRQEINQKLASGTLTQQKLQEFSDTLDMELSDYANFQQLKSLAVAEGKLSLEEGQTVYALLGETPSTFNQQGFAEKYVLTMLLQELLAARIAARMGS